MDSVKYSIVIPIYNEQESLTALVDRLRPVLDKLDGPAEVVLVDDGSRDASYPMMIEINRRDPRFKIVQLSRNFRMDGGLTAGLEFVDADAVVLMTADLRTRPR